MTPAAALQKHFGHAAFRDGQEAVIRALLDGHSVLALFPTGAGKSLCYQLPALLRDGTALVVSPLIALMKEQVESLQRRGIAAARLDSTLDAAESAQVEAALESQKLKLLYTAPERLANEAFRARLARVNFSLLAVDEAHCISEWGHNFRPEYLRLAAFARDLNIHPVLALTATATPETAADIRRAFGIAPEYHVQTSFHRPNLQFRITPSPAKSRLALLTRRLRSAKVRPAIVYVTQQETAGSVATHLQHAGFSARAYHAGMPDDQRAEAQEAFMSGRCEIMVATIAFGMGIDKADIRSVFHFNLPRSLENYVQETGRAGRDGRRSLCELLACADDRLVLENFICGDTPAESAVRATVDHLLRTGPEFDISRYELSQAMDIRPLVIETILTHLELDGLLTRMGSFYRSAQVRLVRTEEQIMAGYPAKQQRFLRALFNTGRRGWKYLTLDIDDSATQLSVSREKIQETLSDLETTGDIGVKPVGWRHRFRLCSDPSPRDPAQVAARMVTLFAQREARDMARLDEVLAFAAHPGCLTRLLLARFGEVMPADCGHCENCRSPRAAPRTIPASPVPEITLAHAAVIQSVAKERHAALRSPRQLTRFLCGITSPATTRAKLTQHDSFGLLAGIPFRDVLDQVESFSSFIPRGSPPRPER